MGKLIEGATGKRPTGKQVGELLDRGSAAWNAGRPSFVWRQDATGMLDQETVNDAIDGLLEIGWRLEHTALSLNTIGPNTEVGLFVFLRSR